MKFLWVKNKIQHISYITVAFIGLTRWVISSVSASSLITSYP